MYSKMFSGVIFLISLARSSFSSSQDSQEDSLHKEWTFLLLRISSVNMTKSAVNCGFGHIYWRNPQWKTSFFVHWVLHWVLLSVIFLKIRDFLMLLFLRSSNSSLILFSSSFSLLTCSVSCCNWKSWDCIFSVLYYISTEFEVPSSSANLAVFSTFFTKIAISSRWSLIYFSTSLILSSILVNLASIRLQSGGVGFL